jgi:hypothetical protein
VNRRRPLLQAATGWPWWLAVDGYNLVAGPDDLSQRWHREIGRSHEDDAQGHGSDGFLAKMNT